MSEESDPVDPNLIASYETETPYGLFKLEVHILNRTYIMVRLQSPFIEEWAGVEPEPKSQGGGEAAGAKSRIVPDRDIEEIWEEIHPWDWEEPDEFPQTQEQFVDYLACCAVEISREFECRILHAAANLREEAAKYHKRWGTLPSEVWLLERYPKCWRYCSTTAFKQRVIKLVLGEMERVGRQLSLF